MILNYINLFFPELFLRVIEFKIVLRTFKGVLHVRTKPAGAKTA